MRAMLFGLDRPDVLLAAAQCLFMMLPLCSLFMKRHGRGATPPWPQLVAMASAVIAFALLVLMFSLSSHWLGVGLSGTNLCLRLLEALRVLQLACRGRKARVINAAFCEPLR